MNYRRLNQALTTELRKHLRRASLPQVRNQALVTQAWAAPEEERSRVGGLANNQGEPLAEISTLVGRLLVSLTCEVVNCERQCQACGRVQFSWESAEL